MNNFGTRRVWFKRGLRFFVAPAGFLLAFWQVKRYYWKHTLIRSIKEAMENEPVPFSETNKVDFNKTFNLEKVKIDGKCLLVGPKGIDNKGRVIFSNAVICPALINDVNRILIHFGWLPIKDKYNGPLFLENVKVIREKDEPSNFLQNNDPGNGIWRVKDISQLSQYFHTDNILLRCIEPVQKDLIVRELDVSNIPNRHLEYVLTWTGLSITAIIFSFLL